MAPRTSEGPVLAMVLLVLSFSQVAAKHILEASEGTPDLAAFESERIFVEIQGGPTIGLELDPRDNVVDLMVEIARHEKLAWNRQQLRLNGAPLEPNKRLAHYDIRPGTTLALTMQPGGHGNLSVVVETRAGLKVPLVVKERDSIASVKSCLAKLLDLPEARQRLLRNGMEVQDGRLVVDYTFDNSTVFQLGDPLDSCENEVEIFVKTLSGARVPLRVSLADTVASLKSKIERKTGVLQCVQRLGFGEWNLYDSEHLCDRGIRAGSSVHMVLYSKKVQSPSDVRQFATNLRPRDPHSAPIFREIEDQQSREPSGSATLYGDARNWHFGRPNFLMQNRWIKPIHFALEYPDHVEGSSSGSGSGESTFDHNKIVAACNLMARILEPRWTASDIDAKRVKRPGIEVGASWHMGELLNENLNNYAPDAFSDADMLRLFELVDRVRRQLEHDSKTGQGNLDLVSQRTINGQLYAAYRDAIADVPLANQFASPVAGDECGICHDDLDAEPSVKLSCGHSLHTDCALGWAQQSYQKPDVSDRTSISNFRSRP